MTNFIKDISFEIPTPETFITLEKDISKYKLTFDITSKRFKKNIIEVNTTLKLIGNKDIKKKIHVEITGTSLVSIEGNFEDKKSLEKIILIEVPTHIYPTLYDTFILLFEKSQIKNLNIEKNVDFEQLYKKNYEK